MPHFETAMQDGHAHHRHTREDVKAFTDQARRLAHLRPGQEDNDTGDTQAVEAKFITPLDPVIETANGGRLPTVPVEEAAKLNRLKDRADNVDRPRSPPSGAIRHGKDGATYGAPRLGNPAALENLEGDGASLGASTPPSRTNPLFPPLPMYGPPSPMRTLQCWFFRVVSAFLSLGFLLAICAGAAVDGVPRCLRYVKQMAMLQDPKKKRPFYEEEAKRAQERRVAESEWLQQQQAKLKGIETPSGEKGLVEEDEGEEFVPTEGGPDPLLVDIGYYARRVGLDAESFDVTTEDGFIIELVHLFNPRERSKPTSNSLDRARGSGYAEPFPSFDSPSPKRKYPVLLMHGLLQSAGAYCSTDDDSLAFYLCKSGYDVWLGNNRCGFNPRHTLLQYGDPRMWAWNIRQMGVMDLAALVHTVLEKTGFEKLGLIAHSQGTTQTFVALAKEQRPELGEKISVFCALAPAAYAGPLIGKIYFKVMRLISPALFRMVFGIHAFIPLMMKAHGFLPARFYGWFGYHVFSFLFSWSDNRWDQGLRDRMFQWAPTFVSAESMRWWLGRECFARQKCILATREEGKLEDKEDEEDDEIIRRAYEERQKGVKAERGRLRRNLTSFHCEQYTHQHHDTTRGKFAWYDHRFPPLAIWVGGADNLVDGRRLLRRFDRGREPHVRVVHKKVIEGYEHLDVIWAMDSIEKVGREVREVLWRTVPEDVQRQCRVPIGCGRPVEEDPDLLEEVPMVHSGGRLRMASISEMEGPPSIAQVIQGEGGEGADMDRSKEQEGEHDYVREDKEEFDPIKGRRMSEAMFQDLEEKANPLG